MGRCTGGWRVLVALIAMTATTGHAQSFLEQSYVVVRHRSSRQKDKCTISGRLRVEGAREVPPGTMLVAVKAILQPDGKVLANDIDESEVAIAPTGSFHLKIHEDLPVVVSALSPGHDAVQVVLSTCEVELDFFLAKSK